MKRFLVVDDDKSIRTLYKLLIERRYESAHVDFCPDGKEGLAMAKKADFDIIVSDINMPVMDGISFHANLKQQDRLKARKVVMVSANVYGDHLRYIQEEDLDYIEKPFRPNQFYAFVDSILDKAEPAVAVARQRKHDRLETSSSCLLEAGLPNRDEKIAINAETIDYSEGGVGLIYKGEEIPSGTKVNIFIEALDIFNRRAKVVWTSVSQDLSFRAGLQWL
ncbi:MAG: response regulator [bacterium]|nr:response regulator [bacterium]